MNFLAKTRKKIVDISGNIANFTNVVNDRTDQFMKFLSTNSEDAYTRPWHRLERGLRLNRIRKYVAEETERFQFTQEEQQKMFDTIIKALDKKLLNSKSIVVYDHEQQRILEIKGFSFHKNAEGVVQFLFTERKTGTMRRKQTASEPKQQLVNITQEESPSQN